MHPGNFFLSLFQTYSLLLFGLCNYSLALYAQSPVNFHYSLQYADSNRVHVTLLYSPPESDSTVFTFGEPRFGGQTDIINCISEIRVSPPARLKSDRSARLFKLYYPGTEPVYLEYEILDTSTGKKDLRQELFRPMIRKDYFYAHGVNLFLTPEFRKHDLKATLSVDWSKKPGFPIFYGFDPGNGGKKESVSTVDSVMFNLLTGARDLTVDAFDLKGTRNYIVLRSGSTTAFNRKEVKHYFTRFNETIRNYWNDYSDPCFSLVLQPFLEADHNVSGAAFANGFIGKYKGDTIVTDQRVYTISHEIGHHWVGHRLEMNISHQWFGEGFNDYITFLALYSSGLTTVKGFEDRFNEVLKAHYGSPVRETPNDSVFMNYWKMGDYNKLPYRRGSIFAFYLDNQIRMKSGGTKSLRDLMNALLQFRSTKPADYELSVADFIGQLNNLLPPVQVESVLEKYIWKGSVIHWTPDMLLPVFRMETTNGIPRLTITDENQFDHLFKF